MARGPTCQPMMKMMATRLRVDVGISGFGFITYSTLKNNKLPSCQWRASASPKGSFFARHAQVRAHALSKAPQKTSPAG